MAASPRGNSKLEDPHAMLTLSGMSVLWWNVYNLVQQSILSNAWCPCVISWDKINEVLLLGSYTHLISFSVKYKLIWNKLTQEKFRAIEIHADSAGLFYSFGGTIRVIIRLNSRYCYPIVDFRQKKFPLFWKKNRSMRTLAHLAI